MKTLSKGSSANDDSNIVDQSGRAAIVSSMTAALGERNPLIAIEAWTSSEPRQRFQSEPWLLALWAYVMLGALKERTVRAYLIFNPDDLRILEAPRRFKWNLNS